MLLGFKTPIDEAVIDRCPVNGTVGVVSRWAIGVISRAVVSRAVVSRSAVSVVSKALVGQ